MALLPLAALALALGGMAILAFLASLPVDYDGGLL